MILLHEAVKRTFGCRAVETFPHKELAKFLARLHALFMSPSADAAVIRVVSVVGLETRAFLRGERRASKTMARTRGS